MEKGKVSLYNNKIENRNRRWLKNVLVIHWLSEDGFPASQWKEEEEEEEEVDEEEEEEVKNKTKRRRRMWRRERGGKDEK